MSGSELQLKKAELMRVHSKNVTIVSLLTHKNDARNYSNGNQLYHIDIH